MEILATLALFYALAGLVTVIAHEPETAILWLTEACLGLAMVVCWPVAIIRRYYPKIR